MAHEVKDLTGDQLRRIFRDYLIGRPREKLIKKYDISEEVFWEIVGMYSKKKHPNDVGNAESIEGPADLLVSPLDTGSTATENPIVARNPEDLAVRRELMIEEFDYNSPEEELRKKRGEVDNILRERAAKKAEAQSNEAREVIKENKEATDAILEELSEISKTEKTELAEQAIERAKATPSPEEALKDRNEEAEGMRKAEIASELVREEAVKEHAKVMTEQWPKLVEQGKKQNEEAARRENEARERESAQQLKEAKSANEAATDEREMARQLEELSDNVGDGSGKGTGSDSGTPSDQGDKPESKGGAANPSNTSVNDQGKPTEPAKVAPMGLKPKK